MRAKIRITALVVGAGLASGHLAGANAHIGGQDWYPAGKNCFIVSISHHGGTKESALEQSQANLPKYIDEFRRDRHWSKARTRVRPAKATPNPSLRDEVPKEAFLKPDVKTKTSYSQCWTGVIWPVVCTSGAKVCKR